MGVRIVLRADLAQRGAEEITQHDALAEVHVAERVHVHPAGIAQILTGTCREVCPRSPGGAFYQAGRRPPAVHHRRFPRRKLAHRGRGAGCLRCGDRDHGQRDAQDLGRRLRKLGLAPGPLAAVVRITADGEILDQAGKGPEPLQGVLQLGGPVGVGDHADPEVQVSGYAHPVEQDRVVQKRLAALKVDPVNRADVPGLMQDPADVLDRHRAILPGTPPDEAVVALEVALVGEQKVQTAKVHPRSPVT